MAEKITFDHDDRKAMVIMRALCELASANFPSDTEVKMSCNGHSMGSVTVKPWFLIKLLDLAAVMDES
jgi:hypothetical protein